MYEKFAKKMFFQLKYPLHCNHQQFYRKNKPNVEFSSVKNPTTVTLKTELKSQIKVPNRNGIPQKRGN